MATHFQCSCLENPRHGGAWWAAVYGVAKGRTRLSTFIFTFHFHALEKAMPTHSSVLAWRIPGTGEPGGLAVYGVAQSQTRLKHLSGSSSSSWWCPVETQFSCFCFWLFRSSGWDFLVYWYLSVHNLPQLPKHQLFLVPYNFFAFCCSRRALSSYKHCSKRSWVPACLRNMGRSGKLSVLLHVSAGCCSFCLQFCP